MLGELTPIIVILVIGAVLWQKNAIKMLEAKRLSGADTELQDRVAQLEQEMDGVRGQLSETQERLDFAERMLTQVRDAQKLPPGSPPPPPPADPTRKL